MATSTFSTEDVHEQLSPTLQELTGTRLRTLRLASTMQNVCQLKNVTQGHTTVTQQVWATTLTALEIQQGLTVAPICARLSQVGLAPISSIRCLEELRQLRNRYFDLNAGNSLILPKAPGEDD